MSVVFHSTRGLAPETDIRGVALAGLAPDGGLYLPKTWPRFSPDGIAAMRGAPYQDIAFHVLRPFFDGAIADDDLEHIVEKTYAAFDVPEVTPLRALGGELHILELFHGPTLAFKDVALQFLGHMFDHFLRASGKQITIIGATSGDTGSAAIAALAGRANIDLFILYPDKGPSEIQRKQMTCVEAGNVHAIAVQGSFDDCQAIVKAMFADAALRDELSLTTVNSINLLRILAQIVYYFVAASHFDAPPSFVVPTGNFGDIYAGYAAAQCGLPVAKLAVASNSNDILTRFFATGRMEAGAVQGTLSPSMDIQVSSNFERLLFDLCGRDAALVRALMGEMKGKGSFAVSAPQFAQAQKIFAAACADDEETLATIADVYGKCDYMIDPHTAVGVKVARDLAATLTQPVICLATAHPAKFPDTVRKATGRTPVLPENTAALIGKPERTVLLPADRRAITDFVRKNGAA
ncbi:MAG: threonine synthase [Alphaproteobacteria bacterium]|nr:threonine synthase [Alphaproteobacteria bacterium]